MANMDIELFKKSINAMIAKNGASWDDFDSRWRQRRFTKEYTEEQVDELFKTLGLDNDGDINIKQFINEWKFQ